MVSFSFMFNTIDVVKEFTNIVGAFDCIVDVQSDRYIVDGKSIMGLLSLDLSKSVIIHINGPEAEDAYVALIKEFPDKYQEL